MSDYVWTRDRPDREGWWWHRSSDQHKWSCVEVYQENGHWYWTHDRAVVDGSYYVANHVGEHWIFIGTDPEQEA